MTYTITVAKDMCAHTLKYSEDKTNIPTHFSYIAKKKSFTSGIEHRKEKHNKKLT